ncbi:hypothetical protein M9Y10_012310 [Tritrichomonas musculus]|uniref:DUF4201 domain-containing protein n=1 Tax=Tritrichomonas musculus TaxID=1915356 RepID=A0ABR2IDK3_9EUKA
MFSPLSSANLGSSRTESVSQSRIESIHSNAATILSRKNQEIEKYKIEIDECEKELLRLKSLLESKQNGDETDQQDANDSDPNGSKGLKNDDNNLSLDFDGFNDFEELKALHEEEIEEITSKYNFEIGSLQNYFTKSLKEAEKIAEQHAETVYLEKKAELDEMLRQIELIGASQEENQFQLSASKIQKYQQYKANSMLNLIKISRLDQELSDLATCSRTELRDVRLKVDECFVTADIRQKEHENEVNRLVNELESREQMFSHHYTTLVQSYEAEKQKLTEQFQQSTQKIAELRKSLKSMQVHHDQQEKQLYDDVQKLKSAVSSSLKGKNQTSSLIQSSVAKQQHLQREIKQIENEIVMVDKELLEVQAENAQLKEEINRINNRKKK